LKRGTATPEDPLFGPTPLPHGPAAIQPISDAYDITGIKPNTNRRPQAPESSRFEYVHGIQA
jgi:hypothetical protein